MYLNPLDKQLVRCLWGCVAVSGAFLLASAGLECQYYATQGTFPRMDSLPQAAAFPLLHDAVIGLLLAQFLTVPGCLGLLAALELRKVPVHPLVHFCTLAVLCAAFARTSGDFGNWFFD